MTNVETQAAVDWLMAGQTAVAMTTTAMQHDAACNPEFVTDTTALMAGQSGTQIAITATWLARIAASAIVEKHGGDREAAAAELAQVGLFLAAEVEKV